jgi:hypothetical protein
MDKGWRPHSVLPTGGQAMQASGFEVKTGTNVYADYHRRTNLDKGPESQRLRDASRSGFKRLLAANEA